MPAFIERQQALIDGAKAAGISIVQIFHVEEQGPFSEASGLVVALAPIALVPSAVFRKRRHSALVGSGLDVWLTRNGIRRVIIFRHPHRTVLRDHDSTRLRSWLCGRFRGGGDVDLSDDGRDRSRMECCRDPRSNRIGAGRPFRSNRNGGRSSCRTRGADRSMKACAAPAVGIAVFVVVPPRVLLLDVAGPIEVLRKTNLEQDIVRFDVIYVGPLPEINCSVGLSISGISPLPERLPDGALVVIAGSADIPLGAPKTSRRDDAVHEAAIVDWLQRAIRPGIRLASICSGALLAARAGLLDDHDCTTHHACIGDLARLAPSARVKENRLYVEDGERLTSAGITAGIDMMLHFVAQHVGHPVALSIARYLVVYLRRGAADPQLSPWLRGAITFTPPSTARRTPSPRILPATGRSRCWRVSRQQARAISPVFSTSTLA